MQIGELFVKLGFKVDDADLKALETRLDNLTAKAKGVAGAFKDAGLVVSGGGGRGGTGGGGAGRAVATGGEQARTHVDIWKWNQRNEAEKKKEADKIVADKKHAFNQQLHWMRRLTEVSTKVAVGLGAVNASFLAVAEFGRRSAVNLTQFGLNTGISAQTLQRFQQVGSKYDVTPEGIAGALQALAQVRRNAAWGQADFGAINALGLDVNQSPEKMLLALQAKGSAFNRMGGPDQLAFLQRLGLDSNIQQFLARTHGNLGDEVAAVDNSLLLNGDGQKRIMVMDTSFNRMRNNLKNLGLQFTDFASRYLAPVWDTFDNGIQKLTKFFQWLNSGEEGASRLRTTLYGVATALTAVSVAMTALSAAASLGLLAKLAASLGAGPLAGGAAGSGALLGLLGKAGLVGAAGVGAYSVGTALGLDKVGENIGDWFAKLTHIGMREEDYHPLGWTPGSTHSTQTNNITIHAPGGDPQKISEHLEDFFSYKLRTATANMPQFAPP